MMKHPVCRAWTTPTSQDAKHSGYGASDQGRDLLSVEVAKEARKNLWPTPKASAAGPDFAKLDRSKTGISLQTAVAMWPTPTSHNAKECNAPSESKRNTPTLAAQAGGSLNPDWVEWLMNWPIKWSNVNDFDPTEFKRWQEACATEVQGTETLRTVWWDEEPSQAPFGQRHHKQQENESGDPVREVSRGAPCKRAVEGSHEGTNLLVLRGSVHLREIEGEDVQSIVREQTRLDEAPHAPRVAQGVASRVDRLRCIGNGQVPAVAALAFRTLERRLTR